MANHTPNLNLEKPLQEEFYDVDVQNGNMDKIDAAIETVKEDYVKKSGDTMTGQLIAKGGVEGDLTGTADKAIADKNGNDIEKTYLPLNGGTLSGDLLIDDSAEHGVKGSNTKVGFYWNASNFGAYDWGTSPRGIWAYNQSNKILTFNPGGGINADTVLNINAAGNFAVGSFTFNDDTETKIVGKTSQVGISFNQGKYFDIYDWKNSQNILNYDGGAVKLGPGGAGSNIYTILRIGSNAQLQVYKNDTQPPAVNYYNANGQQGVHSVQNGTHFFYNAGDSVRGNLAAAMLDLSDGTMEVYASVDSTDSILSFGIVHTIDKQTFVHDNYGSMPLQVEIILFSQEV